ncbi:MAG: hypothetical protein ABI691_04770 [Ginsengibacter sp.]
MEKLNKQETIDPKIQDDLNNISSLEAKRIKQAIERTDTEKFHLFCRMMRIQIMLDKAVVTHR